MEHADVRDNFIIFPNQLFKNTEILEKYKQVWIVEEPVFFTRRKFHKLVLATLRASLKWYHDYLTCMNVNVQYIQYDMVNAFYSNLTSCTCYDPVDNYIRLKIKNIPQLYTLDTPYFISDIGTLHVWTQTALTQMWDYGLFYKWQRKTLNVLMNGNEPMGGKYTYTWDGIFPDMPRKVSRHKNYRTEAIDYINANFANNYGYINLENFTCAISWEEAQDELNALLFPNTKKKRQRQSKQNLEALVVVYSADKIINWINRGLLTPYFVMSCIEDYLISKPADLPFVEFIIREIIGKREFSRLVYEWKGEKLRGIKAGRLMPDNFFIPQTKNELINIILNKVSICTNADVKNICLCLFTMCMIKPDDIYTWLAIMTGASDWLLVNEVWGPLNYNSFEIVESAIRKLKWPIPREQIDKCADIWNALYYNFIGEKRSMLRRQGNRGSRLVSQWTALSAESKEAASQVAGKFMNGNI